MKLIDADALLEYFPKNPSDLDIYHIKDLLDLISNIPTIEQKPVAIVDEVAISVKGEHIFNGVGKVNVGDKLYELINVNN